MANYSLVINSKFQPFSFERYLQPYQIYGQAYREQEDAYADLATKAATVESMANKQTDPESYEAYQNYANALKAQADVLASEGLTPSSRRAVLDLRKRYTQEVVPIQDAYNRRKEQAKLQAEIMAKDPTHMFARMAATTSLDDYRNNKNLDLTLQNYSGALLTKQVSDAAAALAKGARNDPNMRTQLRRLLPYQYETIRQTGFSLEAIREAIARTPNASKELIGIVDNVMNSSGIADWNFASQEEKQRIWDKALKNASEGLWSAAGQTQYGTVTDSYGMQSALIRAKAKAETETETEKYRRIANSKVLEADTTSLNNDLKFLQKLSKTGVKNLSKKAPDRPITSYRAAIGAPSDSSDYDRVMANYRRIAREYGLGNVKAWGPNNNAILINKIQNRIRQNIQRVQTYQVNMTDQTQLAKILQENSNTFSIRDRSRSGFNKINDDGEVTRPLTADEAAEMFEKGQDFNLSYNPIVGFQLSYREGKTFKTANVEPDLINFGDTDYTKGHKAVNDYINHGNFDYANDLLDEMMTGLYYRFNTQAPRQSATDSNIR